jgi:deoxyribose-phosphate aldolase
MNINQYIDHTLLKPTDIEKLSTEAIEHSFHDVCINSCYVSFAKKQSCKQFCENC